jgi:hypothetical protein
MIIPMISEQMQNGCARGSQFLILLMIIPTINRVTVIRFLQMAIKLFFSFRTILTRIIILSMTLLKTAILNIAVKLLKYPVLCWFITTSFSSTKIWLSFRGKKVMQFVKQQVVVFNNGVVLKKVHVTEKNINGMN